MSKLYFLRHGIADWPNWDRSDDERPLNEEGKKETKRVAAGLAVYKVRPDVIFSSPLPRALQTAKLTAKALDMEVTVEPSLAPGFEATALRDLLAQHANVDVMLVGHEPDFSTTIKSVTGAAIVLPKSGLVRVDLTAIDPPRGELRWLIPPKFLKSS